MLNEFYDIAKSLEAAGIKMVPLDKRIKGPSAGEKLCFELSEEGNVSGVRVIPAAVIKKSWTIANGNKNSFPFLRLQDPLLVHSYSKEDLNAVKKDAFKRGAALTIPVGLMEADAERFDCRVIEISDWERYREKIEQRKEKLDSIDQEMQIVPLTHERFLKATSDFPAFTDQLTEALLTAIKNPSEDLAKITFSLIYEGGVQVCFEAVVDDADYSIIDPSLKPAVSECLAEPVGNDSPDSLKSETHCAISNDISKLNKSAFPKPKLPLMGPTLLFARKEDVRCRHRYDQKGVESMAVGNDTISQMHAGILAICSDENEGKTWAKIPSETPSSRDLLIAYVESGLDIPIADALNEEGQYWESQSELDEAAFVEKTRAVTEAIKGHQLANKSEARLRLLVIRKVDTANKKIVYSGSEPVRNFLDSSARWIQSFEHVPPIHLTVPVAKGKPANALKPFVLSPANFIVLSKERFKEGGTKKDEVPGGRFFDVLQLLLGEERNRKVAAHRWLQMLLPRRRQLLIGIGHARTRSFDEYKAFDSWGALSTVSAFHLLLTNLGRNGELYMSESAYKLGQLLAAADELHCGYCYDVRKGSLPSQLMGNALVAMAERNPLQALNVLCRKWPVYQAWAKKSNFRVDEKFTSASEKLSKKDHAEKRRQWSIANGIAAAFKAGPLCSELKGILPRKTDQQFRAELILGYIAGLKSESNK